MPVHAAYSDEHSPLFAPLSHELHEPPLDVWQLPLTHAFPLQEFPHEPQLLASVFVSTHLAPHDDWDDEHAWSPMVSVDVVTRSSHACESIV